jgi:ACS family glucarate transporter-like MFS transporter
VRYLILSFLFVVTALTYADRQTLTIVQKQVSAKFGFDAAVMGNLLAAFSWAYAAVQIPGGWLLDRFGAKRMYGWSIALFSVFTLLQGLVGLLNASTAVIVVMFGLRFLLGLAEAPTFPANSRIVATWFPTAERGLAAAIFNSAQYASTVMFVPAMGWVAVSLGWQYVFWLMGALGIVLALLWPRVGHGPRTHPLANAAEVAAIERGGGLPDLDRAVKGGGAGIRWSAVGELLQSRMLLGIYLGQYCINVLSTFFLLWLPIYLVQARGLTTLEAGKAVVGPALCGLAGGVLGGVISDWLLRRGCSLTVARKFPIVGGLMLSACLIACNYVRPEWAVITLLCFAYFGKGVGSLGWSVVADASPKEIIGLSGGLFNMFGNVAGITTSIVIGHSVKYSGAYNGALWFVAAHAVLGVISFLFVVGEIKRVELKPQN